MTNPNCFTCRHAQVAKQQDGTLDFQQRICVEGPPQVIALPTQGGIMMQSVFPVVVQGMLCDRHDLVPNFMAETPQGSG